MDVNPLPGNEIGVNLTLDRWGRNGFVLKFSIFAKLNLPGIGLSPACKV